MTVVKIVLGVLAALYALAQVVQAVMVTRGGETGASGGSSLAACVGLALAATVVSLLFFRSALRRSTPVEEP
jgi:uncharacterized membrane protein YidH (DUF202 family)